MYTTSQRPGLPGAAIVGFLAFAVIATAISGVSVAAAYAAPAANLIRHAPDRTVASLIAPNGDRNPFGIAVVPLTSGPATAGNSLVAEFSDQSGTAVAADNVPPGQSRYRDPTTSSGRPWPGRPGSPSTRPMPDAGPHRRCWKRRRRHRRQRPADHRTGQLKATFTERVDANNAASFVGVRGQGVSSADGTVTFYYGNAGNATTVPAAATSGG